MQQGETITIKLQHQQINDHIRKLWLSTHVKDAYGQCEVTCTFYVKADMAIERLISSTQTLTPPSSNGKITTPPHVTHTCTLHTHMHMLIHTKEYAVTGMLKILFTNFKEKNINSYS